jgi:hypothetical protein
MRPFGSKPGCHLPSAVHLHVYPARRALHVAVTSTAFCISHAVVSIKFLNPAASYRIHARLPLLSCLPARPTTLSACPLLLAALLLQYAAKAVLTQPINSNPPLLEVQLSTRHPCFTCSECRAGSGSQQQQQQQQANRPGSSAVAAAAAEAADEEEEPELQLCPVHVCAVYEMRASDVSNITKVCKQQAHSKWMILSRSMFRLSFACLQLC